MSFRGSSRPRTASPASSSLAGPADLTVDTYRVAGGIHVTMRQLQWWDERHVVQPRMSGHRRLYAVEDVMRVAAVAALREKGLSLQAIRKALPKIGTQLETCDIMAGTDAFIMVAAGGRLVEVSAHIGIVGRAAIAAKGAVYMATVGPEIRAIFAEDPPRRRR